jgi:hypothetical protein
MRSVVLPASSRICVLHSKFSGRSGKLVRKVAAGSVSFSSAGCSGSDYQPIPELMSSWPASGLRTPRLDPDCMDSTCLHFNVEGLNAQQ